MKYYITCKNCSRKFNVATNALTRSDLPTNFNLTCPFCRQINSCNPWDVYTETSILGSQGMAVLGGLVGLLAGGAGALLGAGLGAAVGKKNEEKDREAVERFNSSWHKKL